jgi:energy-coupling factor transporter ATP-binding protein EcfA2
VTRVVVIGAPGSGKTTLSRTLAAKQQAQYVELDAILHGEGGREPSVDEFGARALPELQRDSWVVDGRHERRLGTLTFERANTVVFLDPPLPLIMGRLLRRSLSEILVRKELWNGNQQTWRGAFGGRDSLISYAPLRQRDLRRRVGGVRRDKRLRSLVWSVMASSGAVGAGRRGMVWGKRCRTSLPGRGGGGSAGCRT